MHDSHQHTGSGAAWSAAAQATLHCLTGCAVGEVLGMVIGTAAGLHDAATVVLSTALAFVFGYALTMRGVLRAGLPLRAALRVALAADTVSIAVMEVVDNAVVVAVPGAMDAGLTSALFWLSLAGSLAVAFVVTTPVNRWMIGRGRGHAVVHRFHHGDHDGPGPDVEPGAVRGTAHRERGPEVPEGYAEAAQRRRGTAPGRGAAR